MARGRERHQERERARHALGRDLSRRARSTCELCESAGEQLHPWEVPPLPEAPDPDRAVLICPRCTAGCEGGRVEANAWRFLESTMWSEVPAVQVVAVRLLKRLSSDGATWARDALDGLYLEEDVQAWADEA